MLRSLIYVFLLACLLGSTVAITAEEQKAPTTGTLTGILTAKGSNWIEVKADGEQDAVRYIPYWRGGMPKDGGGFDKAMLETINKLVVPNRVKLSWEKQEHLRIVSVDMLLSQEKSGTVTGVITALGKDWIEVKADGKDGVAERYMPRWIGKNPSEGGGFDKVMLQIIAGLKVGARVELKWIRDERKRVIDLEIFDTRK